MKIILDESATNLNTALGQEQTLNQKEQHLQEFRRQNSYRNTRHFSFFS